VSKHLNFITWRVDSSRNIDRLIALYQVVRPNTWVEPSPSAGNGNFWIPNGITLDADMQMQPFWKDSQSFYTSNDVRNTSVFGYAYPETQYWNYGSDVEWRAAVNASIALQYSPSSRDILAPNGVQSGSSLTHLLKDNTFTDWTIKTKASSLDMPPTFRVEFSLVDLSSLGKTTDLGMWLQQTPGSHGTGKMMQRSSSTEKTMEHTISLTSSLLDQIKSSGLKSLDTRDVVPYLKGRLTWRVISVGASH
jgi:tyrosinase